MNRRLTAAFALIAVVVGLAGDALAGGRRRVEEPYGAVVVTGSSIYISIGGNERFRFRTRPTERHVTVELDDVSGLPVAGTVGQDLDRNSVIDDGATEFCGATERPVPIKGGSNVLVEIHSFDQDCNGRPALPTSGTLIATFIPGRG